MKKLAYTGSPVRMTIKPVCVRVYLLMIG